MGRNWVLLGLGLVLRGEQQGLELALPGQRVLGLALLGLEERRLALHP
jgi:hypothetical protein